MRGNRSGAFCRRMNKTTLDGFDFFFLFLFLLLLLLSLCRTEGHEGTRAYEYQRKPPVFFHFLFLVLAVSPCPFSERMREHRAGGDKGAILSSRDYASLSFSFSFSLSLSLSRKHSSGPNQKGGGGFFFYLVPLRRACRSAFSCKIFSSNSRDRFSSSSIRLSPNSLTCSRNLDTSSDMARV